MSIKHIKTFLHVLIIIISVIAIYYEARAQDLSQNNELYTANEAGGVIALTKEKCKIPEAVKMKFLERAYATEGNGTIHEGCWTSPDISEAPKNAQVKIIPLVNLWFDNEIGSFPQNIFSSKKDTK